ncbi:MAG: DUF3106 domain-containing protein [Bryobacteraceae bacterium]
MSWKAIWVVAALAASLGPAVSPVEAQLRPRVGFGRKLPVGRGARRNPAQLKKQIKRINGLTPEERSRLLERLPPERRKEAEKRLQRFNDLKPDEQDRLLRQYSAFQDESPERQHEVRRLWSRFNQLPDDRKPVVRDEVQSLRRMAPEERSDRMESTEFRDKFDAKERRFLGDMAKTFEPEEAAVEPEQDQPE